MITIERLTKKYGPTVAVDDVSFTASAGRVTGFLGPNGAGKSTTMRIMVGLTRPTSGTATIFGRRFAELPNPGLDVGVHLAASAQHAGHTGREILTLSQQMMGLPRTRVEEMLDVVNLTPTEANRRVPDYSWGCVSGSVSPPPSSATPKSSSSTNQPTGWTRPASAGCATSCAASPTAAEPSCCPRSLHEIEVIADDIVVIGHGKIVAQGTKTDLLATAGTVVQTREASRSPPHSWPPASPSSTTRNPAPAPSHCASTPADTAVPGGRRTCPSLGTAAGPAGRWV